MLDSDPVARAVCALVERHAWTGTHDDLLAAIIPDRPDPSWPRTARGLAGRLKRLAPALRDQADLVIEHENGTRFSKSFRTRAEGDRYRSRMLIAHHDGERFDTQVGQPISWLPAPDELQLYEWARQWVAEEWPDWAPRSRRSAVEALSRFLPLACDPAATDPPDDIRSHLRVTMPPGGVEADGASADAEDWLRRLGTHPRCARAGAARQGRPAARNRRCRPDARGVDRQQVPQGRSPLRAACLRARAPAVRPVAADAQRPEPAHARRKRSVVDIRRLPDPTAMAAIVKAIRSHQPGSRTYQVMTAVSYVAGLRPSEVVMLRPRALHLPAKGWGTIDVVEADVDWDEPGEPKTGPRSVPSGRVGHGSQTSAL